MNIRFYWTCGGRRVGGEVITLRFEQTTLCMCELDKLIEHVAQYLELPLVARSPGRLKVEAEIATDLNVIDFEEWKATL